MKYLDDEDNWAQSRDGYDMEVIGTEKGSNHNKDLEDGYELMVS